VSRSPDGTHEKNAVGNIVPYQHNRQQNVNIQLGVVRRSCSVLSFFKTLSCLDAEEVQNNAKDEKRAENEKSHSTVNELIGGDFRFEPEVHE
jgi:hypothetical protein